MTGGWFFSTIVAGLASGLAISASAAETGAPFRPLPEVAQLTVAQAMRSGAKRKRASSLLELPRSVRREVTPQLNDLVAGKGRPRSQGAPPTEDELDLACDQWFILFEEDENGDPVPGTAEIDCE